MSDQRGPPGDAPEPAPRTEAVTSADPASAPTLESSLERLVSAAHERGMTVAETSREPRLSPGWHPARLAAHASRSGVPSAPAERTRWSAVVNLEKRPWLGPLVQHLEALDFGLEEDSVNGVLRGRGPEGMTLFRVEPALLQTRAYVAFNERSWTEPRGALALANRLSEHLLVSRATLDDDADLAITATHVGEYERRAFQAFMTHWLADLRSLPEHGGDAWAYYCEPLEAASMDASTDAKASEDANGSDDDEGGNS